MELRKKSRDEADAFPLAEGSTEGSRGVNPSDPSARPESKSSARTHTLSAREPGDLESASSSTMADGRQPREGRIRKPRSQASEESDEPIVPMKSAKTWVTPVKSTEGRGEAKGKLAPRNVHRTQGRERAPTNLERVGRKATKDKETKFSNLMCHLKVPLLEQAYKSARRALCGGRPERAVPTAPSLLRP